jgi:hypothetical protein
MDMAILQPRDDGLASGVDDCRPGGYSHLPFAANMNDLAIFYQNHRILHGSLASPIN